MKRLLFSIILLVFLFCCAAQSAVKNKVDYLGSYSSLAADSSADEDPHFNGYSLDLFREGDFVFGSFEIAAGTEEVTGAPIEAVKLDFASHHISFRARMSLSREYGPGMPSGGRPSRDLIEFNGKITVDEVSGTLLLKDGYNPNLLRESKFIVLKHMDDKSISSTSSYAQWLSKPWNHTLSDNWEPQ
jgi:hypothetical protein